MDKSRSRVVAAALLLLALSAGRAPAQTVREWLLLGAYGVSANKTFETDFMGNEAGAQPHGGLQTAGRTWRHFATAHAQLDLLDPTLDFFPVENAALYAHVYVKSPKADTVKLYLGYDDRLSVRVNGQLAWQALTRRDFQSEGDTASVILREGWNRVLFKIYNAVGEWSLAARFAAKSELVLQAETPERLVMIPRADPELIRIRAIEPAEAAVFTKDNRPALQFKTVLYNPQQHGLGMCEARLVTRSGKVIGNGQTFALAAGEVRTVYFLVPAAEILASFEASGAWQVRLQFDKHEVRRIVPLQYDARLLGKILGTFEVEGFEPVASNGASSFRREIVVPWQWESLPLLLSADFGEAQGEVFVNGEQKIFNAAGYTGDLALADSAAANARYEVLAHVTAPSAHAQRDSGATRDFAPPKFFLTVENAALLRYLNAATLLHQFRGDPTAEQKALDSTMFAALKSRNVRRLNQLIAEAVSKLPKVEEALAKTPEVSLIASAPLTLEAQASFNEITDLYRAAFQQALRHLEKYPGFYFTQGQAAAYWWLEQRDPSLFQAVQSRIAEQRWEIVGGSWVESEASLISGESLARQFLYGKRYLKEKFGVSPNLAWLPNALAHPANLPQVLEQSGMSAAVVYHPWEALRLWQWQGLDGSEVLGYRPAEEIATPLSRDVSRHALVSKQNFRWPKALRVFGLGQNRNGASGRDIRLAEDLAYVTANREQRFARPSVRMTTTQGFFDEARSAKLALPKHHGEIKPVHYGLWSNQGRYKMGNRQSEMLLPVAEAFALIAQPYGFAYPQAQFTSQWRNLLASQVQSLLAGTAHPELYREGRRLQREAAETAKAALDQALTKIEAAINTKSAEEKETPVVIYNPSAWPRTDYVEVELAMKPEPPAPKKPAKPLGKGKKPEPEAEAKPAPYFREAGNARVPAQILLRDSTAESIHYRLLFLPENVPALGYKTYWLQWDKPEEPQSRVRVDATDNFAMSNRDFSVLINAETGGLERLVDNYFSREWMASPAGGLEVWSEKAGSNLTIVHAGEKETLKAEGKTEVLEAGPLRGRLRTRFQYHGSEILQEYVMYATLPRLEVHYTLNWSEQNKTVKLVYPFNIPNHRAHAEIPFGVLAHNTNGEAALVHKWLDLSNEQFGLTLANTGSYSMELQETTARLTILRSSQAANLSAEENVYRFGYALAPHRGDWVQAQSGRTSHDFNQPLHARVVTQHAGGLPPQQSFVSVEPAGVVLSALKKAEDDESWIIRVQENHGANTTALITLPFAAAAVSEVNLLEWEEKPANLAGARLAVPLKPWEVKTLKVKKSVTTQ